ncbi:MAG: UDP-3-O-(3-hydroxymyristoyl)glucosamine N-acyltransferase [Verrucomicrobia bacterium]|nr:UDP-3-O-(3-hydroxymyristoyl)glucosamine N-acyltransferase [Verrucomicrobiota bacterium]
MTVSELAALVGGQLASGSDGSAKISGAAALAEALPGEVTFFGNPKYLLKLRASRATVALVPLAFAEKVPAACIRCENPTLAFSKVIEKFAPPPVHFAPGVHPTAVVAPGVRLGAGVSIQPHAVIEAGASIGDGTVVGAHSYIGHEAQIGGGCLIHPRVMIGFRCKIGSRVILHSGAVLGGDGFGFELQDGRQVKIPQIGIVQVDDDVEIGANSTVDRARFGRTWIGEGTKIDNLVQIGHNVVIGKHCILCAFVGVSGSTKIGDYVTLAGQVGTVGHVEIGDGVIVGAQAGVSKTLAAKQIYMGSPAVPAREWKEQVAQIHSLHKLRTRVARLEQLLGELEKSIQPEI